METGLKQMKCGGCGGELFKVFTPDAEKRIAVECQQCDSVSWIVPSTKLDIEWGNQRIDGEDSMGRLTVFGE